MRKNALNWKIYEYTRIYDGGAQIDKEKTENADCKAIFFS